MAKILYLSSVGLSYPVGQSQVLPYLQGLSELGHDISLITFEKRARIRRVGRDLRATALASGIRWAPLSYTKHPPVLSTLWDLHRLRNAVRRLHREHRFDLVHCRSYPTALVGLELKRAAGVRFVFDMRGFWADEKVEGGAWSLRNPLFRSIYRFFKAREAEFVAEADAIVSLTDAGRREIERWQAYAVRRPPISVIPCATDFGAVDVPAAGVRAQARTDLNIPLDSFVVVYLGSLGTWYMLDEMLEWFALLRRSQPESRFLWVTPDDPELVRHAAVRRGIDSAHVVIVSATRERVPFYLAAADTGLFFIRPTYSKQSSCPTKLGELLAMGIPVIANAGVGDVDQIITTLEAGLIVPEFSVDAYVRSIEQVPSLRSIDPRSLRTRTQPMFDLPGAVAAYDALYRGVLH